MKIIRTGENGKLSYERYGRTGQEASDATFAELAALCDSDAEMADVAKEYQDAATRQPKGAWNEVRIAGVLEGGLHQIFRETVYVESHRDYLLLTMSNGDSFRIIVEDRSKPPEL